MSFWRLVLAIACGIIVAEAVNGVAYEVGSQIEIYRYRHRGAEEAARVQLDPYETALDRVKGRTATVEQAVADYCRDTLRLSDNPLRAAQQVAGCKTETTARITRDLQ
jgi:hypothetical protein